VGPPPLLEREEELERCKDKRIRGNASSALMRNQRL
jgi:hypothetical protein